MTSDVIFLMPVFNASVTELHRTLASLQAQSFPTDILLVDDGSFVPAASHVTASPSIHLLRLPSNLGIVGALNAGLDYITAGAWSYIARMDVGDQCDLRRIEKQREYLITHPDADLVGCLARVVSTSGKILFVEGVAGDANAINKKLFDNCAFKHPTFFFRTSLVNRFGAYSAEYPNAEDYEFLRRVSSEGRLACISDTLLTYVRDENGLSLSRRRQQLTSRVRVQIKYFSFLRWRSYAGLARSLIMMLIPVRFAATMSKLYWSNQR